MRIEANLEQKLLMLTIIFLPLNHFPVELPVAGGEVSRIFLFLGVCFYLYKIYTKKVTPDNFEKLALVYLAFFLLWQVTCTIIGILEYSYYDLIYLEQMDKLRYLLQNLKQIGIRLNEMTGIKMWLMLRFIKDCVLHMLVSYGASLWIYHLYKEYRTDTEKQNALVSHVTAAVSVLCLLLITYSVVETGYLRGSKFCQDLLSSINPRLYEIGTTHGFWPQVLLPGQLRSLFVEPAFFGVASVIIIFVLFYKNLTTKNLFYSFILSIFVMMTVMTGSRTAIPLFAGQFFLLMIYVFVMDRMYIKETLKIILIVSLSLFASLYLMAGFKPVGQTAANTAKPNVEAVATNAQKPATGKPEAKSALANTKIPDVKSNLKAVSADVKAASDSFSKRIVPFTDERSFSSDMSRLNSTKAYFITGLQNPVFGVGKGLSNAYADANYMKEDVWRDNLWSLFIRQEGVLRSPIPVLNHWSNEAAQFGFVGLIIFLLPVLYILLTLIKLYPKSINIEIVCATIAYIGSNVAMLSNPAFLTYYILTGVLLVLLRSKTERQA